MPSKRFDPGHKYVSIKSQKVKFAELEANMMLLGELGYKKFKPVQQACLQGSTINQDARREGVGACI